MRGEDATAEMGESPRLGSPPHARGRRRRIIDMGDEIRITPACAGKTLSIQQPTFHFPDHPRMRGEDASAALTT